MSGAAATVPAMAGDSLLRLAAIALALAVPLVGAWVWRHRRADGDAGRAAALAALGAMTLVLTFDLIVFGAFTRLTDSGLGCPDWPGCYGQASPIGARADIQAEQALRPDGPVTHAKAWIEMVHRYLAMAVGTLIALAAALAWRWRRVLPHSPWWPTATLVWVVVQGLFGRLTVTWKLQPGIVTAHLLGALGLLALLAVQQASFRATRQPSGHRDAPGPSDATRASPVPVAAIAATLGFVIAQVALGGWVSTNYAVLACDGFPTCNGRWLPALDPSGLAVVRDLGHRADGTLLPFSALVTIHWLHRAFAVVAAGAVAALAWRLRRDPSPPRRRAAVWLAMLVAAQFATGVSNVVLDWPIVAALAHSAGAAALVGLLASTLADRAFERRTARGRNGLEHRAMSAKAGDAIGAATAPSPAAAARTPARALPKWRQFVALTKPRVVQLIVFCAVIGMLLAVPDGLPPARVLAAGGVGIWLVASAAAVFNCLVEQTIDRRMARTAWRPTARGELDTVTALAFSLLLCAAGSALLWWAVNPLTMALTLATFVGYAIVYTVVLKPLTPQNIVIGGASGAMPPVLGWAAVRGDVGPEAILMCLIIFVWTPPHFWALALYRVDDYRRAGLPMLPVTHGADFTRLNVLLYTLVLLAATLLPFVIGMSGWLYLACAVALGARFVHYGWRLWRGYSDALARRTFRFSIVYLAALFAAMLADHYLRMALR